MAQTVNWGILGAAKFARTHMGPAIHSAKGARLVALATSDAKKAVGFQALEPSLRVHLGYDALLADPDIDAVYVPLPNHLHVEWTKRALEAGKHVLTEKPIAMNADDITGLIAVRDAANRFATEAFMIVHHPQWQRAKQRYEAGDIGELKHVEGIFCYNNASDGANIRNRADTGGGGIPDIGVYTYGATRWLTGQEPEAIAHADVTFENRVDVIARVSAQFPGFTAHWVNSMRMMNIQHMVFIGTEGVMTLTAPFNAGVFDQAELEISAGSNRAVERWPGVDQYVLQVEAFGQHIRDQVPYPWTLEDARGTQALIDAVFEKAQAR